MPEPDRGVPVEDRPELWAAMLATEVRLADRRIVPVGPPTTEVPASPDALVVVTAWNPGGRARPAPVNAGADRRLVAELDRRRLAHEPAVGAALDGSWAEPGHLVAGLDRDGARALGRAFGQVAVFEWSQAAGVLAVVACDGARVVGRPARVAPVQATGAGAGPPGEGAGPSGC